MFQGQRGVCAGGSFQYECSLSLASLLSVSFTSSSLVSRHNEGQKPRSASRTGLRMRCVFMCGCAYEGRPDIFNGTPYLTRDSGEEADRMRPILCRCNTPYTHTHPWSVPPLPSPLLTAKCCYALIFTLWVNSSLHLSHLPALSLLHFLCLSGSVSLPAAVWMAGPTALGCLGSGGIPISSSNHDIILPKWVKDVARIFPAFLFCSLPSNYINYMLPATSTDSINLLKDNRSEEEHGKNAQACWLIQS